MAEKTRVSGGKLRWQTYLTPEMVETIRRAAHHLKLTTGEVVEVAVTKFVKEQEKRRGKPFGPISRLRSGRPLRESE